jgi:DNA polymerase III sliding clamp (beta) subunit (PCNA family)
MVMEVRTVGPLQRAVSSIAAFVSEGNVRFNAQGVFFRETDPSQIVLADFFIPRGFFSKFSVEPAFVGIDLGELNRILSRSQPNDLLRMDLRDSELVLELEGDLSRKFFLPLIDVAREEPSLPSPKFEAVVQVNARVLKEALKDAALFGNSVVLKVKDGAFLVESRGNQGVLQATASQASVVSVKQSAEAVGKFNLTYLQNILKEAENDKRITLELRTDSPAKVSFVIADLPIQFYLAHMIL